MSNTMKITNGYTKGESTDPENGLKLVLLVAFMVMIISLIAGCPVKAQTMRTGKVIADTLRSDSALILADGTVLKGASDLGGGNEYINVSHGIAVLADTINPNMSGTNNFLFGKLSGQNITTGSYNVSMGYNAGNRQTTSSNNVYIGTNSGNRSITDNNVYIGNYAGSASSEIEAEKNIGIGYYALQYADGGKNIGIGTSALGDCDADYNIGIGSSALGTYSNPRDYNIAIGVFAGYNRGSGTNRNNAPQHSIFFGNFTRSQGTYGSNEIVIGDSAIGKGSNTAVIGDDNLTAFYANEEGNADVYGKGFRFKDGTYQSTAATGSITETDPIFTAWDKDYNDLINKPAAAATPTIDEVLAAGDTISSNIYWKNPIWDMVELAFRYDEPTYTWQLYSFSETSPLITFPMGMPTQFNTDVEFTKDISVDEITTTGSISLGTTIHHEMVDCDVLKSYYVGVIEGVNYGYFREPIRASGMRSDTCTTTSYRVPMNYALINLLAKSDSINISIADWTYANSEYGDTYSYYFDDLSYVSDVYISADGQNTKLTFPADWKWIGETPTSLTDGQTAVINMQSKGSGDTNIVANYRVLESYGAKQIGTIADASVITIDMLAIDAVSTLSLTQDTEFKIDTTGLQANGNGSKTIEIYIEASANIDFTFPAYAKWVGLKPVSIASGEAAILSITNYSLDNSKIVFGYVEITNGL